MSQDAARDLALSYCGQVHRPGFAALLALDDRLAGIIRSGRDPMLAQIRLTWWVDALERLDATPPPAEPVLRGLAAHVLPHGVTGKSLAKMAEGWEILLEEGHLDDAAVDRFAAERGAVLFTAMATLCVSKDPQAGVAGEGWALADLTRHVSNPALIARVRIKAVAKLRSAFDQHWSRNGRGLGALALIARFEAEGRAAPISRIGRLLVHRFTGR